MIMFRRKFRKTAIINKTMMTGCCHVEVKIGKFTWYLESVNQVIGNAYACEGVKELKKLIPDLEITRTFM